MSAHFPSFSSSLSLSWSFPLPCCCCTQGNRIFYCTGKALSVPHEGRLEVEFPPPFRQKKDRPITSFTTYAPKNTQIQYASRTVDRAQASLSQFDLSPEHDDKMLANVSWTLSGGPRVKQPLERIPSQTNTGLHQGFPQTSAHFSVPAMGFFPPSNTYKHIYIHTTAEGKCTRHRIFQERGRFLPFCLTL